MGSKNRDLTILYVLITALITWYVHYYLERVQMGVFLLGLVSSYIANVIFFNNYQIDYEDQQSHDAKKESS